VNRFLFNPVRGAVSNMIGAGPISPPMRGRRRPLLALLALSVVALVTACSDEIPTALGPGIIPVDATTFQVDLPFEAFASGARLDGGYGVPANLIQAFLAKSEDGQGSSHPLARWAGFSPIVSVTVGEETTPRSDSLWTVVGGELVLRVDSLRVGGTAPFTIEAHRVTEAYDPSSVSWTHAVDTLGGRISWSAAGGGGLISLGSVTWDPALGDSIRIPLDSAVAQSLSELGDAMFPAVRFSVREAGAYLRAFEAILSLQVRPSLDPDSVYRLPAFGAGMTFIHSGSLDPASSQVLVAGGAPAYRSSFRVDLPETVQVSGPVCAPALTCQFELTPERIVYAGLRLTPVQNPSAILQPADTMNLDLRPVLAPDLLPRAPLGVSIQPLPRRIAPSAFGPAGLAAPVEISLTRFVRDLLEDRRSESPQGLPRVVSLTTASEPSGLGVAAFAGPDTPQRPRLRLILTRSEGVSLP